MIAAAAAVEGLRIPPGNRLERLTGNRTGQWSIRINDQWRICFRWRQGGAEDVVRWSSSFGQLGGLDKSPRRNNRVI